ncbi:MAG: zinc-binding dehydrogenase [Clostridia bacterium]|nr:zinc-binding dehydrogenase [Clostridia bacterium]
MKTMKKMFLVGPGKTEIREVPIPEYNDDQVLVKLVYHGVCMSEHYAWEHGEADNGVDNGFGHEPCGIVEAVGKNVTHVKPGDRVTGLGSNIAEYGVMNKENVYLIPDNVSFEDATGEPLACLLSAVSKVPMTFPGESSVAVVGCGYMGCGAISLLKLRGAGKIVAIDIRKESLENALKYGADEAYLVDELPEKYIADTANKNGFDYVMEWGETEESLDIAIRVTKTLGFLGIGAYHTGEPRRVNMQLANVKAIDMLSTHPRDAQKTHKGIEKAMELLSSGQWNYKDLPVKIYPMDKFDQAHAELETKYGKYMKALVDCQSFGTETYLKNAD